MDRHLPTDVCLHAAPGAAVSAAQALAERFDLPLCHGRADQRWHLLLTAERLELHRPADTAPAAGPVYVDFVGGALGHRRRFGGGRGQPLARAVGMTHGQSPRILDATAGLGRDAFVLASLGSRVTLCERSPVLAALLDDGLRRALADEATAAIARRMTLIAGDARHRLAQPDPAPQVVYLDPMYPPGKASVRVKKHMHALQQLLGPDRDSEQLFDYALNQATQRVVIKRPRRAGWLHGHQPTTSIESKKTRYDIYIKSRNRCP